jgi:hypothetical protein
MASEEQMPPDFDTAFQCVLSNVWNMSRVDCKQSVDYFAFELHSEAHCHRGICMDGLDGKVVPMAMTKVN